MPNDWNTNGDFATVFDGSEAVTLRRAGSGDEITVPVAWRRSHVASAAVVTGEQTDRTEVVWQIPMPASEAMPSLGDLVIDSANETFAIVEIESLQSTNRIQCRARRAD